MTPTGSTGTTAGQAAERSGARQRLDHLRASARTEPGRLRLISVVLAVLVLVSGAGTTWQVWQRQDSVAHVTDSSQPLSTGAADIYRYLADADATAASGFLAGGEEPAATRVRYDKDVAEASKLLTTAAASSSEGSAGRKEIALLTRELPRYAGWVATARAINRQGLPLGGAYLRYASGKMRDVLLPAAQRLYDVETARLDRDYDDAREFPWVALGCGLAALAGLGWAQRRLYRRTNRVFNIGLLAASTGMVAVLLWMSVGHLVARHHLNDSDANAAASLEVLSEARISALKAQGDENLTLVARGSGSEYEKSFRRETARLSSSGRSSDSLLDEALRRADDDLGRAYVTRAQDAMEQWQKRHTRARQADDRGDYADAVARVIGGKDQRGKAVTHTTQESFDQVSASLQDAVQHEKAQLRQAANDAGGAYTGLPVGAALVALLAAGAVARGIGERRAEYR